MKPTLSLPKALDHLELLPYQYPSISNPLRGGVKKLRIISTANGLTNKFADLWLNTPAHVATPRESVANISSPDSSLKSQISNLQSPCFDQSAIRSPQLFVTREVLTLRNTSTPDQLEILRPRQKRSLLLSKIAEKDVDDACLAVTIQ